MRSTKFDGVNGIIQTKDVEGEDTELHTQFDRGREFLRFYEKSIFRRFLFIFHGNVWVSYRDKNTDTLKLECSNEAKFRTKGKVQTPLILKIIKSLLIKSFIIFIIYSFFYAIIGILDIEYWTVPSKLIFSILVLYTIFSTNDE